MTLECKCKLKQTGFRYFWCCFQEFFFIFLGIVLDIFHICDVFPGGLVWPSGGIVGGFCLDEKQVFHYAMVTTRQPAWLQTLKESRKRSFQPHIFKFVWKGIVPSRTDDLQNGSSLFLEKNLTHPGAHGVPSRRSVIRRQRRIPQTRQLAVKTGENKS